MFLGLISLLEMNYPGVSLGTLFERSSLQMIQYKNSPDTPLIKDILGFVKWVGTPPHRKNCP